MVSGCAAQKKEFTKIVSLVENYRKKKKKKNLPNVFSPLDILW